MTKAEFAAAEERLSRDLVEAQFALRDSGGSVVLLLGGDDGPGCNGVFDRLRTWMDPRFLHNRVVGPPTPEERQRPPLWRFWRGLPPRGEIAVWFGGWTGAALDQHLDGELNAAALTARLAHIVAFEALLQASGTHLVKFWLHLQKPEIKRRRLAARTGDLDDGFYRKRDLQRHLAYAKARDLVARVLHETSLPGAAWQVLDSRERRQRDVTVAEALLTALHAAGPRNSGAASEPSPAAAAPTSGVASDGESAVSPVAASVGPLAAVDLSNRHNPETYEEELERLQARLTRLTGKAARRGVAGVLVFEGWDAAGKGGAVRRLTAAVDAANYRVHPIAAPSEEARRYPYLWRFWRRLPPAGQVCVFDRSWYGRVLVERVERLARPEAWSRAYDEICDFEAQLLEHGYLFAKFWLHVSPEEQLARFRARERDAHKQFKIGPDDWRNRARWGDYEAAVNEMVERTNRPGAAWRLVAANDKRWARLSVLRQVCELYEDGLRR